MHISLVIPVRNEEASLPELIDSIRRQTRLPHEVILVDGGSTDKTVALAHELIRDHTGWRVLEAGEATPGRGRNVGIAAAAHEWSALTDAGVRLDPMWLARLTAVSERDINVRVVFGNYEPVVDTFFKQCAAIAYVPPKRQRLAGSIRGPSTASMLLHRGVWRDLGGFPDLRAAEDLIFMERVEQGGYAIGWAPNATAFWNIPPSLAGTFRRFALYSKHNVRAGRQRYWHYGIARQYLAAVMAGVLGLSYHWWFFALIPLWFAARVAKTFWIRRNDVSAASLLNPFCWLFVAVILAAIDVATFKGWLQALRRNDLTEPTEPICERPRTILSEREATHP